MLKRFVLSLILMAASFSAVCYLNVSGSTCDAVYWSNASAWNCSKVPGPGDTVIIDMGSTPTVCPLYVDVDTTIDTFILRDWQSNVNLQANLKMKNFYFTVIGAEATLNLSTYNITFENGEFIANGSALWVVGDPHTSWAKFINESVNVSESTSPGMVWPNLYLDNVSGLTNEPTQSVLYFRRQLYVVRNADQNCVYLRQSDADGPLGEPLYLFKDSDVNDVCYPITVTTADQLFFPGITKDLSFTGAVHISTANNTTHLTSNVVFNNSAIIDTYTPFVNNTFYTHNYNITALGELRIGNYVKGYLNATVYLNNSHLNANVLTLMNGSKLYLENATVNVNTLDLSDITSTDMFIPGHSRVTVTNELALPEVVVSFYNLTLKNAFVDGRLISTYLYLLGAQNNFSVSLPAGISATVNGILEISSIVNASLLVANNTPIILNLNDLNDYPDIYFNNTVSYVPYTLNGKHYDIRISYGDKGLLANMSIYYNGQKLAETRDINFSLSPIYTIPPFYHGYFASGYSEGNYIATIPPTDGRNTVSLVTTLYIPKLKSEEACEVIECKGLDPKRCSNWISLSSLDHGTDCEVNITGTVAWEIHSKPVVVVKSPITPEFVLILLALSLILFLKGKGFNEL